MNCVSCSTELAVEDAFCQTCGTPVTHEPGSSAALSARVPWPESPQRFRLEEWLGEGGMKVVFRAYDAELDRQVAIGFVRYPEVDTQARTRLIREARAMSRLGDHPNIVGIHDILEFNGQLLIVVPYLPGGSVRDQIRQRDNRRLEIPEALKIGAQVARALAHAHARGVIHRDVKPANVWLNEEGVAQLGDFGVAISDEHSRITQPWTLTGTIAYLAPEHSFHRDPIPASDLYSLGVMLYEMVAGRRPFTAEDPAGLISQHLYADPLAPSLHEPGVPPGLDRLILRLLAKSPEKRPAGAQDVAHALDEIADSLKDPSVAEGTDSGLQARPIAWGGFVGRHEEMNRLKSALEAAFDGRGGMVLIAGEPGIGKSRLTEEFQVFARFRGAAALTGHCHEDEGSLPYLPFVEALREHLSTQNDDSLRDQLGPSAPELGQLSSEIRRRLPETSASIPVGGDAQRLRLFEAWCGFQTRAAAQRPLVFILEDLQWADRSSLSLLLHWARRLRDARVLVIGTYRDAEVQSGHPSLEAIAALQRERLADGVVLKGLTREEIGDLIIQIAQHQASPEFVDTLARETQGNPFFIGEILRHLIRTERLRFHRGHWTSDPEDIRRDLPESVRGLIRRRLNGLSSACLDLLRILSCMAGGCDWECLRALHPEHSEEALLDLIDEALEERVLSETRSRGTIAYEFNHALFRQTLYEELGASRRALLHRRIGETMEDLYRDDLDRHAGDLAEHFYQAVPSGDSGKAMDYLRMAANRSLRLAAYEQAIDGYRRALELAKLRPDPGNANTCELMLELGTAFNLAGQLEEAHRTFIEAADLGEQLGRSDFLARAALGYGEYNWASFGSSGADTQTLTLLERAATLLGDEASALHVAVLARYWKEICLIDRSGKARELERRAVAMAEAVGDPVAWADVVAFRAWSLHTRAELESMIEDYARVPKIYEQAGQWAQAAFSHAIHTCLCFQLGRMDDVARGVAEFKALAKRSASPDMAVQVLLIEMGLAMFRGELPLAEALCGKGFMEAAKLGSRRLVDAVTLQIMELRRIQGRLSEMEPQIVKMSAEIDEPSVPLMIAEAMICSESRREDRARELVNVLGSDDFAALPRDIFFLLYSTLIADVVFYLKDSKHAEVLYSLLLPYADLFLAMGAGHDNGSVARSVAAMAALSGSMDESDRHFSHALEANERIGARPWLAITQYQYAWMLKQRRREGDEETAVELIREARLTAETTGMKGLLSDLAALDSASEA